MTMHHQPKHEIPNAFLIRALARGHALACTECGSRMFVRTPSGKCPWCRAGAPQRVSYRFEPEPASLPFAPRLGDPAPRPSLGARVRAWSAARRAAARAPVRPLALAAGEPSSAL